MTFELEKTIIVPMERKKNKEAGVGKGLAVLGSLAKDLASAGNDSSPLPSRIWHEASQRRELSELLDEAVKGKNKDIFYERLGSFLSRDENNARIILYLPFEVLPDIKEIPSPTSQKTTEAIREGFIRLLFDSNARGDFDDGDVLEPGMGNPPRTRKAAHLIFPLLDRGIISQTDIVQIMEFNSGDKELIESMTEGSLVANALGLFDNVSWQKISKVAQNAGLGKLLGEKPSQAKEMSTIDEIKDYLHSQISYVENKYKPGLAESKRISRKRADWKKDMELDAVYEEVSSLLSVFLINKKAPLKEIFSFGTPGTRAVIKSVETLAKSDGKQAKTLADKARGVLTKLTKSGSFTEKAEAERAMFHFIRLGYFRGNAVDVRQPEPVNIQGFVEDEGAFLVQIAEKINADNELKNIIFPFVLVFGSKIKGYANQKGDFDMAIFFRPNADFTQREKMLARIKERLPELGKVDKVLEYWTSDESGKYGLKEIPDNAAIEVVGLPQIHFIFGGIWVGENEEINKVRTDVFNLYLDLSKFGGRKENIRRSLLRQLEIDTLQYRLMHKGYRRLYPEDKNTEPPLGKIIDYRSAFWDNGYRHLASVLFLNKVFLPDLSEEIT